MSLRFRVLRAPCVVLTLAIAFAGCGGGNSSKSPTAPGSNSAAGTWTGTLTRPAGLAPMSVRWQATVGDSGLTGPLTLTNGGSSVTITAKGSTAGNDKNGYTLHMQFTSNVGEIPGFPNCRVLASTSGNGQGDPFRQPYNTISIPSMDMFYSGCNGFVEYPGQSNALQETAALSLNRQ